MNPGCGSKEAICAPWENSARLAEMDLVIHHSTPQPRKLVKNDGTVDSSSPVVSVRPQSLSPGGEKGFGSSMFLKVKSCLSVRAPLCLLRIWAGLAGLPGSQHRVGDIDAGRLGLQAQRLAARTG